MKKFLCPICNVSPEYDDMKNHLRQHTTDELANLVFELLFEDFPERISKELLLKTSIKRFSPVPFIDEIDYKKLNVRELDLLNEIFYTSYIQVEQLKERRKTLDQL